MDADNPRSYQHGHDFKFLFELPISYNKDGDKYCAALRTVDRTGDYMEWLTYFPGGFAWQMVRIKERAREGAAQVPDQA